MVASLLLHAGLGLALGRAVMTSSDRAEDPATNNTVSVRVVTRPQRNATSTPSDVPEAPAPAESAPVNEAPSVTDAPIPVADTAPSTNVDTGDAAGPVLDSANLQDSISTYMATYRSAGLEQQLRECQQYRERYARWDCPQGEEPKTATQARIDDKMEGTFRDWVYGRDLNIAIAEKLMTEMLTLRPLMNDNGVMGDVARDLEFLKTAEYERLTGRVRDNGLQVGPLPSAVGGTITVLSIGGGGITLLNGWSIGWDGKVRALPGTPAPRPDEK